MAVFCEALKNETRALHERLDDLPYFSALQSGTLPKTAIVSYLRCLSVIHAILERSLSHASDPRVANLGRLSLPKVSLLASDLKALGAEATPSIGPAIQIALELGAKILQNADFPFSLVGTLYVLEGSQNGGAQLRNAYARCLEAAPDRLSYFGCYGTQTAGKWKAFVEALNLLELTEDETKRACDSAVSCFEGIAKICAENFIHFLNPISNTTFLTSTSRLGTISFRRILD